MPAPDPLQLLTTAEVAALMGKSVRWVQLQVKLQRLVAHRVGRSLRFWREDVAAFQASFRSAPEPVRLTLVVNNAA